MKKVFKDNPKLKKCYGTSDGEFFYQENDAKNHAKTLDDKTVECLENENFLEVVDAEELTEEQIEAAKFDKEAKEAEDLNAAKEKEAQDAADAKILADAKATADALAAKEKADAAAAKKVADAKVKADAATAKKAPVAGKTETLKKV